VRRRDTQSLADYLAMIAEPDPPHTDFRFDLVIERALAAGADVAAVSFDLAVHSQEGLLATLLSAGGLEGRAIGVATLNEKRANESLDWRVREAVRMLNGVLADKSGLPQDDLCRAVPLRRPVARFFDLAARWQNLDPGLAAELYAIVDAHGRETDVAALAPDLAEVTLALERYASRFRNLPDAEIFGDVRVRPVVTTDLDWRRFYASHARLAENALRQLLSPPGSRG
jgi:hypothetical protein